jgi:hypothetical protein
MADALQTPNLSPEAIELIQAGTPKPKTQTPILAPPPTAKPLEASEKLSSEAVVTPKPKPQKEKAPEQPVLVALGFRVPLEISQALFKVASERKLKRIRPFTQQDIIAEALSDWIKKNVG